MAAVPARGTAPALLIACTLLYACQPDQPDVPDGADFEWRGDWIDIFGFDTTEEQTCAGTFAYLDAFAGSTASEFGVTEHLGIYRWYSPSQFATDSPCTGAAAACSGSNGVFSRVMPFEHEVVHLANDRIVACPSVIAEGLAEYYGMTSKSPTQWDVGALIAKSGQGSIDFGDYPLAGAFAAHLVESYGLSNVLGLCERSGVYPSMQAFAEATQAAFGASLEQVLLDFAAFDCSFAEYRSKHFECGAEPDAIVGAAPVEFEFEVDCASPTTVGPREQEIWTLGLVRIQEAGTYLAEIVSGSGPQEGLRIVLTECAACYESPRIHKLVDDGENSAAPVQLRATDYVVEVFAPPAFADVVRLRLSPL
jgi:hypothetical protein